MAPQDRTEFAQLVTDVLAYYRQDASRFTLALWWNACQPYTLAQLSQALTAHATDPEHGQFAPKVADLVRQLSGTHTERAALAWGKTLEAMQAVGAYQDVVFDDPAIHAVVQDLGGWPKLCRTPMAELGHVQHRFCTAHRAYTARGPGQYAYPRRLAGDRSPDGDYAKKGLPPPTPMLVGDVQAAQVVLASGTLARKTLITDGRLVDVVAALPAPTHANVHAHAPSSPLQRTTAPAALGEPA